MGRFDRSTHFEAGEYHGYLRSGVFLPFLLVCLLCAPLRAISAEDSIEKDLQADLGRSREIVVNIEAKLAKGAAIGPDFGQLKAVAESVRISNLLMEERFKLREEKVKSLGAKAVDRHEAMVKGYRKALAEYLALIDKLPSTGSIPQSEIRNLQSLLDKLVAKRKRPIIGSLPYKHLNYPAIEPSIAPEITPAYRGGNKIVSPDDTKSTLEAPISKEIAALAQSLNWQPAAIYEHVKNTIETEWYWGCQKGAEETLRQKSGNDCDQALLLSSLLKASGFPTRLVRGNIQFFASDDKPIERVKNLTGIDDPAKIAEFFQKAGIPYKPIIAGGKIANFQIEHIWIESLIPMANYRGAILDEHGKTWIGLDTAIKVKGYEYNQPKDLFEQAGIGDQLSTIREKYLALDLNSLPSTTQPATPLEYLQSSINAELQKQNSQLAYADFQRTRVLLPEVRNILPSNTQFTLIKATNEYTSNPDELVHKIRFIAANSQPATSSLLDITLPLYKLSNQQIAISYEPETVQDQEIVDSYGGLDNTPSYLVRLRPVLKINGERIVVATDGLPMGADYTMTMELYSPSVNEGVTPVETITNTMITGNLTVIGITAGKAMITPSPLAGEGGGEGEKDAERLLYEAANHYTDRWNQAEDELASLLHLTIARPLPTVVTLAGMIDVTYLLDMPHDFTWKGVYVDADLRRIEAVRGPESGVGSESEKEKLFMQLSSLQGSILENRIFEDDFKVESISTAKLFQLISQPSANSYQLLTIDKTNIDSILPALSYDDSIKEDITNSVNQNYTIKIPESDLTYHDWTGTGYMKENAETGESGWMLSGMIAGGCPVDAVWLETHFQNTLGHSYEGIVNNDPLSAAWLRKIAATDEQPVAVVNSVLPKPLAVFVADSKGTPVPEASVTFKIIAGGGMLQCLNAAGENEGPLSETNCTATAGANGIAQAALTLGKSTDANPQYMKLPNDEFSTQIGVNLVTAIASGHSGELQLDQPFTQYGKPDGPAKIKKFNGDGAAWYVNNPVGSLRVKVLDQYDNVVSNVTVTFSAQTAESIDPSITLPTVSQGFRNIEFYKSEECNSDKHIAYPLHGDCATYYGGQTGVGVKTEFFGAVVNAVLGNTVNTKYKVKATALIQSSETFTTFTLSTFGSRDNADGYISPSLQITRLELYNDRGELVNAAKAGTELKAPLTAALALYTEETTTEGPYQCTINNQQTNCWKVKPVGVIKTKKIADGTVTFIPKDGNGLVTATTITNSQYQARYTTGVTAAKNTIEAFGEATVSVPEVFYDTANNCSASRTAVPVDKEVTVKSGQFIAFEKDSGQAHTGICGVDPATHQTACAYDTGQYEKVTYTVFGVNAALAIEPEIILLNDEGYSTVDTTFKYTILPPEYNAIIADVDIYKTGANADEWINYIPGDKTQGQGTAGFVQGTKFDINTLYKAQVVLNRGTDVEIRSDKKEIPLAQLKVLTEENPSKTPDELKFGDGTRLGKKYRMELLSRALLNDCTSLSGKITSVNENGLQAAVPGVQNEYYLSDYPIEFSEAFFDGCKVRIKDMTDNGNLDEYLILSNKSRADLDGGMLGNPALIDTVVLYGGIGNTFKVVVNGAQKLLPIEPMGVIVLALDGLRQDVLYNPEEQQVNDLNSDYYVQPENLKGFCDVLGGKRGLLSCDKEGWEKRHIKLPEVTAIFPSITLASWASIFTGMMPGTTYDSSGNNVGGTGILGNEYFARDLYGQDIGAPRYLENGSFQRKYNPAGVISFSSGAFRGYDQYGHWEKLNDNSFFIPYQGDWKVPISPVRTATEQGTPQNDPAILKSKTVFEAIASEPGIERYFKEKGGDPVVVANNHYARGAYWLTWDLNLIAGSSGEVLDRQSWDKFDDYLSGKYKTSPGSTGMQNEIPFSALTVWYLPGLDHQAHASGMSSYKDYFNNNTDVYIGKVVDRLKELDELNNKIFIVVADHGHTAMPENLTYRAKEKIIGLIDVITEMKAEMSCELKLDFTEPESTDDVNLVYDAYNRKEAERNNNNLHIWELGEVMKKLNKQYAETSPGTDIPQKMGYRILAPSQIADLYNNSVYGAKGTLDEASVIAALNGPMAHIYVKDRTSTDWKTHGRIVEDIGYLAEVLRLLFSTNKTPSNLTDMFPEGLIEYVLFDTIGLNQNMAYSIDAILIRKSVSPGEKYCVYKGIKPDKSDIECDSLQSYFGNSGYVSAVARINNMENEDRSGDIVLLMKDTTFGNTIDRYTTGVACKSWHGLLNLSDSYVPFILAYPGGNSFELNTIIDRQSVYPTEQSVCPSFQCEGNWKLTDIVKEIMKIQY